MIVFSIDSRAGVPTYLQIVQQAKRALRLGALNVGDQLPTVREVVASLAINPNTVLKGYRELEREGLVKSKPGRGTFVIRTLGRTLPANLSQIREGLRRWISSAYEAGLGPEEVLDLMMSALRESELDQREGTA